jgi:hypothetical protein
MHMTLEIRGVYYQPARFCIFKMWIDDTTLPWSETGYNALIEIKQGLPVLDLAWGGGLNRDLIKIQD